MISLVGWRFNLPFRTLRQYFTETIVDSESVQTNNGFDTGTPTLESPYPSDQGPRRSSLVVFASWALIFLVVIGIAGMVTVAQFFMPKSLETTAAELLSVNLTAKMIVGYRDGSALNQAEQFNTGPLEQRYGYAILVNEIEGAESALKKLEAIDEAVAEEQKIRDQDNDETEFPTESQREIRRVIGSLFEQYESGDFDSSNLEQSDRDLLEEKLGWIANLALTPKKSPDKEARKEIERTGKRLFQIMFTGVLLGAFVLLSGFAACFISAAMLFTQQFRAKFQDRSPYGFVYIETFAIWIVLFFGMQFVMVAVAEFLQNSSLTMTLSPVAFFGSLVALAWPMIRGIPFSTMRKDIGWEMRNPFVETAVGGFSYLALIIPMIFGVSISILLGIGLSLLTGSGEFDSAGPAGHPIADDIASGGPAVWIPIFLAACVAAPIVEETMFRGVLYRYLRDATNIQNARWLSVAVSSVIGGLIFAMIHPQGLIGIPILTTLAIGFSLVREWRNSLIGPIIMHAINNSVVTCMLILVTM